jgi:L,D-peptidoglycan transpeptidase YkuD (ErfK/YbiS/YcfS/YnhG family)
LRFPCALGRRGRRVGKREGDGATPSGLWRLVAVRYRADRARPPLTGLPVRPIRAGDGWCDAIGDRNYNRPVRMPYRASAEEMRRADGLYDVVVILDYNLRPRMQGRGSAIFMHHAREGWLPTAGCIALRPRDLRLLLARVGPRCRVHVPA